MIVDRHEFRRYVHDEDIYIKIIRKWLILKDIKAESQELG
jgi:hypothetical protein